MRIGYIIEYPYQKLFLPTALLQVNARQHDEKHLERLKNFLTELKEKNISYLLHPYGLHLSETKEEFKKFYFSMLEKYAELADLALVIHDETGPNGERLFGEREENYRRGLERLEKICKVSIENANNSKDIVWFWNRFANSITLDIGHFEAAGLDSTEIINSLPKELMEKVDFIHLHATKGTEDHRPFYPNCKEVETLRKFLERKGDVLVILEINEKLEESLEILKTYLNES